MTTVALWLAGALVALAIAARRRSELARMSCAIVLAVGFYNAILVTAAWVAGEYDGCLWGTVWRLEAATVCLYLWIAAAGASAALNRLVGLRRTGGTTRTGPFSGGHA